MALKRLIGVLYPSYLSLGFVLIHGVLFLFFLVYHKTDYFSHLANEPLIVQVIVFADLPAGVLSGLFLYPFYSDALSIGIETEPNRAQITYYWVSTFLWFGLASLQWYIVGTIVSRILMRFRKDFQK